MQVVLASHGRLAEGMKDTLGIILGELPDLTTLCAYVDPDVTLAQQVKDVLARKVPGEKMLVVTDLFGGSVNNEMLTLLPEYPAVHLICGMTFFTTKPEGSGIGLSLSRQIMRVSGGSLSLHQDKAQGITTFRIIIP